jgi:hypothetical protein
MPIDDAISRLTSDVKVEIDVADAETILAGLKPVLARHRGRVKTFLQLPFRKTLIRVDEQWYLRPTRAMLDDLQTALGGKVRVVLAGEGTARTKRLQQQQLFQAAQAADEPADAPPPLEAIEQEV